MIYETDFVTLTLTLTEQIASFSSLESALGPWGIIELRKSNGTLSILLHPPHPSLSPDYGEKDKGEGV
jgi:hypothetical protein